MFLGTRKQARRSERFVLKARRVNAVAIHHHLIAGPQAVRLAGKLGIEDPEQTALYLPEPWLAVSRHVQWVWMACPRELDGALAMVVQNVGDGDKRAFRQRLLHQVLVQAMQDFRRR